VTASVLRENGDVDPTLMFAGGVVIQDAGTTRTFDGNTVVANHTGDGPGGARCSGANAVTVRDSILWGNDGDEVAGCAAAFSDIEQAVLGTGNLQEDPMLDPATGYHLLPGSPCIDAADPAAAPDSDVDGDPRPMGPRQDIGADEHLE
jgi:hypothetical protein